MSGFRDTSPRDVPEIPNVALAVARAEAHTVVTLRAAGEQEASQIRGAIHDRSGALDTSVGVTVRRLPGGGVVMRFGAVKKVAFQTRKGDRVTRDQYGGEGGKTKKQDAFYADFVDRGTGIYGPLGRQIKRKGLIRIGGVVMPPSGDGQKPQKMFTDANERFNARQPELDAEIEAELTRQFEAFA